jgi:hypothetical protein
VGRSTRLSDAVLAVRRLAKCCVSTAYEFATSVNIRVTSRKVASPRPRINDR